MLAFDLTELTLGVMCKVLESVQKNKNKHHVTTVYFLSLAPEICQRYKFVGWMCIHVYMR